MDADTARFRTHRDSYEAHARDWRGLSASPPHWLQPVRRPCFTPCLRRKHNKQFGHTRDSNIVVTRFPSPESFRGWAIIVKAPSRDWASAIRGNGDGLQSSGFCR